MRKLIILLLCFVTITSFAQKQKPSEDKRFAGFDTAFARVLKEWHAAGFAVAVVEKDKVVYAKGFGYRDYENKIPVTPNTLFAIGSCTKAFTASLLGILNKDCRGMIIRGICFKHIQEIALFNAFNTWNLLQA